MREYTAPGVFVEEIPSSGHSIAGVSTSTTAFVGPTLLSGSDEPVASFSDFQRQFGGLDDLTTIDGSTLNYIAHAARAFFDNGGRKLYVARVEPEANAESYGAALDALYQFDDISLIAAPGSSARGDAAQIQQALIDHVEHAADHDRYRLAILDSPPQATVAEVSSIRSGINSSRAALYYPWVTIDETGVPVQLPPSGFVCGIMARVDIERGVWKAPANEVLRGASGLQVELNDVEQQPLNAAGVNCIRAFTGRGILLWGARTVSSDSDWKYVNVRRYALYLEQSLSQGLQWAVFEPNGEQLWANVRRAVQDFLISEWRKGALMGLKPDEAFFVHCDRATMTQNDLDNGRLVVEVGIAPLKPAEFVIIRIGLWTASCPNC